MKTRSIVTYLSFIPVPELSLHRKGGERRVPYRGRNSSLSGKGEFLSGKGEFLSGKREFLIGEGRFPIGEGRVPIGEGRVSYGKGEFPIGEGKFPIMEGRFPIGEGRVPHRGRKSCYRERETFIWEGRVPYRGRESSLSGKAGEFTIGERGIQGLDKAFINISKSITNLMKFPDFKLNG